MLRRNRRVQVNATELISTDPLRSRSTSALVLSRAGSQTPYSSSNVLEIYVRSVVLFVLFCCTAPAQTVSRFRFSEQPGPDAVGLKIVEQYDYTRTFHGSPEVLGKPSSGERARPIQILVWYPAQPSKKASMTVADYTSSLLQKLTSATHTCQLTGKTGPKVLFRP